MPKHNACDRKLLRQNLSNAKRLYPGLPKQQLSVLRDLTATLHLSIFRSELLYFSGKWYVSHSGLLRIAHRRRCVGIDTAIEQHTTEASVGRWVFRATVHKSQSTIFVGYGDADPIQCFPARPRRRDARGRNPGRQSRPAQGLRHRHLLGRGNRDNSEHRLRSFLPKRRMATGMAVAPRFATVSARSSASTSSIPNW